MSFLGSGLAIKAMEHARGQSSKTLNHQMNITEQAANFKNTMATQAQQQTEDNLAEQLNLQKQKSDNTNAKKAIDNIVM